MTDGFLSIADIQERWSVSRATVYRALSEMERGGYLRRLWLGRVQRVAFASLERFEAVHAKPCQDRTLEVVNLVAVNQGCQRSANDRQPAEPALSMKPADVLARLRAARTGKRAA
jgi:DNA-binding IclR family transcriptional regulator